MKTKITLVALLMACLYTVRSQAYQWTKSLGGNGNPEHGRAVAVDASGNVYTTGYFSVNGPSDFDPGSGTANLPNAGSEDIYVSKLDASGNYVWAQSMGGPSVDKAFGIAVDANGNVYTVGHFSATVDFDPGAGTYTLATVGGTDIFISKLDASGNFVWAKSIGSSSGFGDVAYAITLDASGNIYTTGMFSGTPDFDPGAGTFTMSANLIDAFVLKLDASGNFVWARKFNGPSIEQGNSIAVDATGNVYTTGKFTGNVDFDPGAATSNLMSNGSMDDIYISKLDASGNFVWANRIGSTSADVGNSIALDATGNVYSTGYFQGTVDFDPGAGSYTLTSAGIGEVYVSKLDASGTFVWAQRMGGTTGDLGFGIAVDASGNVYTTGSFNSNAADFDPGAGTFTLTTFGVLDIFVSKLDASGAFVWAYQMGGTSTEEGYGICAGPSGEIVVTGTYLGTVDFDPSAGTHTITAAGGADVFVTKFGGSVSTAVHENVSAQEIVIYPNPSAGLLNLRSGSPSSINVVNMIGETVFGFTHPGGDQTIDLSHLPNGIYTLKISGDKKATSTKLIIQH